MKKRTGNPIRVVFGFCGILQDDLERYQGVLEVADREGWEVLGVYEQFERSLRQLVTAGTVDAVIGEFAGDAWLGDLPEKLAVVHVGRHPLSARVSSVVVDADMIGDRCAEHLMDMGYEVPLALDQPGNPAAHLQAAAYARRFQREPEAVRCRNQEILLQKLQAQTKAVGVMCFTDFQARQVLQQVVRFGLEVPDQIGIIGVGDRFWDRVAAEMGISSIPLPQRDMGRQAGDLLKERLQGRPPQQWTLAPLGIVPRESSLRPQHPGSLVARVDGIFRERMTDPPDMGSLARRVGMSRRAFENEYRTASGTTPYARLLDLRLQESQRLLRQSPWSVARIGESVGYPEPARFSAFFRNRAGVSPAQWRAKNTG